MTAILKREFQSYFTSAIGYVFLGVFYFFAALFFVSSNLAANTTSTSTFFTTLILTLVVLIPVLTMRLMCEEKKQRTEQLLLTSPVSLFGMVMGKFLAALSVFAMGLASVVLFSLTMAAFVSIDGAVILGNLVGLLLLASALISIGIFISSLTESQIISAVGSIFVILVLYLIGSFSSSVTNKIIAAILSALSVSSRYTNFSMGIFNLGDAVYYLSIAAIFIFLTVRVLEKRRWS